MTQILILIFIAGFIVFFLRYKKTVTLAELPAGYRDLLLAHVAFYRALDETGKKRFEEKIKELLGYIHIHGVKTEVTDLDRLLIASSGVIPIFGFPEWKYYNLRDILLYPGAFNEIDFNIKEDSDILGMVGSGTMQRMMILSKPALHHGFENVSGRENTGIHEFVHLLDKEDGDVDGLPETLLDKQYTLPWLSLVAEEIESIKEGHSDFNGYGAKNKAEFFAVAAEYFFEQPGIFKDHHPELYEIMTRIFNQQPNVHPGPAN
ncbi:MAG: M90 family metallopeptidase [Bacteroidota bacterium]